MIRPNVIDIEFPIKPQSITTTKNGNTIDSAPENRERMIGIIEVGAISGAAVAATLSTALAGANNDMVFTAAAGYVGNSITVAYVDPAGEQAAELVTVTGTAISVRLRSVSATLSTAAQVKAAIEAKAEAAALVTVANKGADTGAGEVIAMVATALTGGLDAFAMTSKWEESDASNMSSATVMSGGASAAHATNIARVCTLVRTKRYYRPVLTIVAHGTTGTYLVSAHVTKWDLEPSIESPGVESAAIALT